MVPCVEGSPSASPPHGLVGSSSSLSSPMDGAAASSGLGIAASQTRPSSYQSKASSTFGSSSFPPSVGQSQ